MDASDTKARDLIDQTVHSTDRSTESNNCEVNEKKRRGKYAMINNDKRRELIKLVLEKGSSIHRAAQAVGINTSTAKGIIQIYKREGRVNKKKTREMSKTIVYNLIMPEMKGNHSSTHAPVMMNTTVLPSFSFGNNNFFPGSGMLPPFQQSNPQVQVQQPAQAVQLPSQFQPLPTLPHPQQINLFGQHQNVQQVQQQPQNQVLHSQIPQQMGAFALNPNAAAQLLLSQYGQQGAFGGSHQYDRATMLLMNMLNNQNNFSSLRNSNSNNQWIKAAEF